MKRDNNFFNLFFYQFKTQLSHFLILSRGKRSPAQPHSTSPIILAFSPVCVLSSFTSIQKLFIYPISLSSFLQGKRRWNRSLSSDLRGGRSIGGLCISPFNFFCEARGGRIGHRAPNLRGGRSIGGLLNCCSGVPCGFFVTEEVKPVRSRGMEKDGDDCEERVLRGVADRRRNDVVMVAVTAAGWRLKYRVVSIIRQRSEMEDAVAVPKQYVKRFTNNR